MGSLLRRSPLILRSCQHGLSRLAFPVLALLRRAALPSRRSPCLLCRRRLPLLGVCLVCRVGLCCGVCRSSAFGRARPPSPFGGWGAARARRRLFRVGLLRRRRVALPPPRFSAGLLRVGLLRRRRVALPVLGAARGLLRRPCVSKAFARLAWCARRLALWSALAAPVRGAPFSAAAALGARLSRRLRRLQAGRPRLSLCRSLLRRVGVAPRRPPSSPPCRAAGRASVARGHARSLGLPPLVTGVNVGLRFAPASARLCSIPLSAPRAGAVGLPVCRGWWPPPSPSRGRTLPRAARAAPRVGRRPLPYY